MSVDQKIQFKTKTGHDMPQGYEMVYLNGFWMVLRPAKSTGENDFKRILLAPENESKFESPQRAVDAIKNQGLTRIIFLEKPEISRELVAHATNLVLLHMSKRS